MRVLVAGLGDVGGRTAATLAAQGHEVIGVRRSATDGPPGVHMVAGDLGDETLVDDLPERLDAVVVTVSADGRSPELYGNAYVDGPRTLLEGLARRGDEVRRVLFTSSSAVYGQRDGDWVDENSPTLPSSPSARILLDAEQVHLDSPFPATVVRLTGIYGPGRTRLFDLLRRGEAILASTPAWTNRIHAADAASALVHLLGLDDPPSIILATDDEPAPRAEVYHWLAARLDAPEPEVDDARTPSRGSKRCSNVLLRVLGWEPAYPSYREGYGELLDAEA